MSCRGLQTRIPSRIDRREIIRVDRDRAVSRAPVRVRSGDPARLADEPNYLTARHGVAFGDEGLTQVEVAGDDAGAVIDVDDRARKKEGVDESDDAAISGLDRVTHRSSKVDTEMTTGHRPVEDATGAEGAGDDRRSRPDEGRGPERRGLVRLAADLAGAGVLAVDPVGGL